MTNAQKNILGWIIVSAVCVSVSLVLIQVVRTFFGVEGWPTLLESTEFWSAIVGAVVGGFITWLVQSQELRLERRKREEDHKRAQQALATSLLLKMIRVASSFRYINQHMTESYKRVTGGVEPWQAVQSAIAPTPRIHFSEEELVMLLAQKV